MATRLKNANHIIYFINVFVAKLGTAATGKFLSGREGWGVYIIKEFVLKLCSKFYTSGGNVAR
jgi:hypothetical protein